MKALRLLEYGGQLVFNDVPMPTIARDEVLVKIKSAAVNHLDLVKASGMARQILPIDLPWVPGHEFSIAGRDREAPCVGRDDEARAVRGRARQNRATAGTGDDTTRRRDRVRAPRCGPGLERYCPEPAPGSWDVAQWAGSGKTQVTRRNRASRGLDIENESDREQPWRFGTGSFCANEARASTRTRISAIPASELRQTRGDKPCPTAYRPC